MKENTSPSKRIAWASGSAALTAGTLYFFGEGPASSLVFILGAAVAVFVLAYWMQDKVDWHL